VTTTEAAPLTPPRPRDARTDRRGDWTALGVLAAITYLPLFLTNRGRLNADTKLYLYLDPGGLLGSAPHLWNRRWSGGTVTHQNIGYLWPMGPYYWLTDVLGIPDWVAQRFWLASIMFAAAAGAYWCFRSLWRDRWAAVAGALVYGLSPFVLGHITGQSALLLPFAALPWLVVAVRNALRADPWRWAAVFALITTTAGSLNGSSIFFVLAGAVLWVPYAVWWERSASVRSGITTIARLAGLTLATQVWWLMAYRVGGQYGLPILQVTETVRQTSVSTSAIEVFRGLGYWFFYGGDNQGPWLQGFAPPFTQSLALVAVSFGAPLAALALGWWSRVRERAFFVALVVVGLLTSTVAFGTTDRSLVGTAFESLSRSSGLVLSLRNTQRAAALLAFGLAGLAAAGVTALRARDLRLGRTAGAVVIAATVLTFVSPWSTGLLPDRYQRPEQVPQAWRDTAAYLDRVDGRAMLLPGIDFGAYRWGHTLDPVLAGLTRTELVWREQLPMGGEPGADLVAAFDESLQGGWFDPRTVVPMARALGVTHIVVANDLEVERYRIVRPETVMAALLDPASGLVLERSFGRGYVNRAPAGATVQQTATPVTPSPLPEVAVFSVPGVEAEPVVAYAKGAETVVHGDGAGVLAAGAAGLLDAGHLPLLSGADLRTWPAARRAARGSGARHVVTDTSRREVRRFSTLRENTGATESADGTPHSGLATDVPSDQLTGADRQAQSVAVLDGARSVDASGYGNTVSLLPEDRPVNAFDGDPRTAWRLDVPAFRSVRGDRPSTLRIDLGRKVRADHVDVVQSADRAGTQPIPAFDVVLDGTRVIPATVDPAHAFDPAGTRVQLDGRPFSTLELRIPDTGFAGPIGIAEVAIPGVQVEEIIRLPRSLDALGPFTGPVRVAYALTRLRVDPGDLSRTDPELALHRELTVPAPSTFTLSGTARLDGRASADVLDAVPTAPRCRTDLLTIDGAAVPVTVGDPTGPGTRGPRPVTTCDGAPITLSAGRHVLRTTPGMTTGIDLDQLALVSPQYADAPTNDAVAAPPEVRRSDPRSAVIVGHGTPYWVRLNQSSNRGWEARARWPGGSQDLGAAHAVDAFASGWSVTRGTDARVAMRFSWQPQRAVDLALAVSGLAVLGCLALVLLRPRRRAHDAAVTPRLAPDPFSARRPPVLVSVLVAAVGAAFAGPAVGAALALLAVGMAFARRARWLAVVVRVAPLAAMGGAVAFVLAKQLRNDYPHVIEWPTYFRPAHFLAYFALLGFALLVCADRSEDLGP